MAYVDWMIKGPELGNCNCAWGCPCQFNALPTHGNCRAIGAGRVDQGHFGDVRLDGLNWALLLAWPGPIHEGGGEVQPVVDQRADERQREGLLKIITGEETEQLATMFNVYAATSDTFHEPLYLPIDFRFDMAERTGRVSIPGVAEVHAEPIRNPVTDQPHRARVVLPHGFEYDEAEFASSTVKTSGTIALDWTKGHAHLCMLHLTPTGVVRN